MIDLRFWPLTNERQAIAKRQWTLSIIVTLGVLVGVALFSVSARAGVIIVLIFGAALIAQTLYAVFTGKSRSQLLLREHRDARQRSAQNAQEITDFMAANRKDNNE